MKGVEKGEEGKKQEKKVFARLGTLSWKGENSRNSLGWPYSIPLNRLKDVYLHRLFQIIVRDRNLNFSCINDCDLPKFLYNFECKSYNLVLAGFVLIYFLNTNLDSLVTL